MPDPDDPASATLAAIRAIELEATAGPWEVHRSSAIGVRLAADEDDWPLAEGWRRAADAEFAAVARTAVPCLLAAVEAVLKLTEPTGEVHRDLDGNEETGLIRLVRCDVLREAITAALSGEEASDGN